MRRLIVFETIPSSIASHQYRYRKQFSGLRFYAALFSILIFDLS